MQELQNLLDNNGFLALIGTIFGGVGVKVVEFQIGRAAARTAEAQQMRDGYKEEIESLRAQLERADAEEKRLEGLVDEWKNRYYDLRDEKTKVVTELTIALDRLKQFTSGPE